MNAEQIARVKLNTQEKYRVWDKETKSMRKVLSINFSDEYIEVALTNEEMDKLTAVFGRHIPYSKTFTFDEVELMQYIGLHDKNKVEIYRRDIVIRTTDRKSKVGLVFGTFVFYWHNESTGIPIRDCIDEEFEVIGNTFKNPEMMEK